MAGEAGRLDWEGGCAQKHDLVWPPGPWPTRLTAESHLHPGPQGLTRKGLLYSGLLGEELPVCGTFALGSCSQPSASLSAFGSKQFVQ